MSISLTQLTSHLNELLKPSRFDDYCPNGLQVEGSIAVNKIVTGVTASQELIESAINREADALLVHHGYFWRGEPAVITGMKRKRIQLLLENNISLLAYHLPLDAHLELGNNVQLAKILGWHPEPVDKKHPIPLVRSAILENAIDGTSLSQHIESSLARKPLHITADREIKKVAWCTGAAQSYFVDALELGADAFISGEISEATTHIAREHNVHYFSAGHHATERYGVKALGEHLAEKFDINIEFVDIDNPV